MICVHFSHTENDNLGGVWGKSQFLGNFSVDEGGSRKYQQEGDFAHFMFLGWASRQV